MKKNYLFTLLCLFPLYYLTAQNNFVPNGDFENWQSHNGSPTEWSRYLNGIWRESNMAQNGNSSLELEIDAGYTQNFVFSPDISFTQGTTYVCSFYYKVISGTFTKVNYNLVHKPGVWPQDLSTNEFTDFSGTNWIKGEFEFTAPSTENIQVYIKTYGNEGAKILIDNVSLVDKNPIVTIPDANFKSILLNHSPVIDTNGDGEIQVSEAESVTGTINAEGNSRPDNEKISDLTGIEAFVNIKDLHCQENNLSSIDLSKNVLLENVFMTNNQITSFDGANLNKLIRINADSNNLTSFNLANGSNELIQQLLINNNAQLFCIQLDADFEAPFDTNYYWQKDSKCNYNSNCDVNNVINIPDNNFKQKLLSNEYINTNQDNEIQYYEAIDYNRTIDASNNYDTPDNEKISDLTGIEHFKKVTELYCSYNKLTSLNVSQNGYLQRLYCSNNDLTQLDLSQNSNLTRVFCGENQLTQLNFSQNTNLSEIQCNDNQITTLDLSQNINLTLLRAQRNQIATLDLSQNTNLTELSCSNNLLTQLDLSQNVNLTEIYCRSNQLTELDLSQNNKIVTFYCDNNQLTDLNIKNGANESIETLEVRSNRLFCIKVDNPDYSNTQTNWFKDDAASYNTDCSNITYDIIAIPDPIFKQKLLDNSSININQDNEIQEVEANRYTGSIYVSNSYSTPNEERISDLTGIEHFHNLTTLFCQYNSLTKLDLRNNSSLKQIECGWNEIDELKINLNAPLERLLCYGNDLKELNLKNGNNNILTTLDLQGNQQLLCVDVDDVEFAYNQPSWSEAPYMSYNTNCSQALTQIATIPDAKFKEDLLANNRININGDNEIQLMEAERVTSLDVRTNEILNVQGLEYFTGLTNFRLIGTQIVNLDLSANTNLKELYCRSGHLTNINLKNGNNANISSVDVRFINTLSCIQVDSVTDAENNTNWLKGSTATYSLDCYATAGIDEVFSKEISIYPNPVEETLTIYIANNQSIKSVQIFNSLGYLVIKSKKTDINTEELPTGVYLVRIESLDNKVGFKKIIKN
ncbi:T9SS type A sorting domain-containing protein [Tenacibaculum xiamenense]|uniref:T9SS type A sorting domain-containing protein n=1 Tax=Tenacibaculum xiamenense TaxID=1261553 RepID=UPI00389309F6